MDTYKSTIYIRVKNGYSIRVSLIFMLKMGTCKSTNNIYVKNVYL